MRNLFHLICDKYLQPIFTLCLFFLLNSCIQKQLPVLETGLQNPMPAEWIDSETGYHIIRLTDTTGDNRSFYFHNNPFIPAKGNEGDLMVFYGSNQQRVSDRFYKGREMKQIFTINLKTHEIKQLTNHPAPIYGEIVGKNRKEVFYQSSDTVFATHVDNHDKRIIFIFPDSMHHAGITALNANETLLAGTFSSPEKDSIFFNNPRKSDFFSLIFKAKLPHTLFTLNIDNGRIEYIHSDTAWINHVQFSPTDPDVISFCHEGPWHLLDRIWTINIFSKKPVLMHKRTMDMEIAGHEFFSRDGKKIWFDLQQPKGETFYLANVDLETFEEQKYEITRNEWSIHFNISPDQKIFAGDGGDVKQVAKAKDGQWIYLFEPDGNKLKPTRLVNMKHHDYDLEPNVHFSPDGKWIIFRANFEGKSQVYGVEIAK